jgi:hypothetical protein
VRLGGWRRWISTRLGRLGSSNGPGWQIEKTGEDFTQRLNQAWREGCLHRLQQSLALNRTAATAGLGGQGQEGRPADELLKRQYKLVLLGGEIRNNGLQGRNRRQSTRLLPHKSPEAAAYSPVLATLLGGHWVLTADPRVPVHRKTEAGLTSRQLRWAPPVG